MVNWVLTRFRVGIEFPYKEAGKIKSYIKRYILPALFIFAQTRVRTFVNASSFFILKSQVKKWTPSLPDLLSL